MVPLFSLGILTAGDEQSLKFTIVMVSASFFAYLLLNGYLLHKNGQTIGKKILNIRVLRVNNDSVTLSRLVFARWFLFVIFNSIPFIGGFVGLVDVLFIFGKEQRCLHDRLADTKVVKVF
ncbi:MAG: putative RDD family membrane protein YckC [Paraglaciecola sp.]